MKHTEHISTEAKEGDTLEERIKVIEEKLNILNEKLNDLLNQNTTVPGPSEEPDSPPSPAPIEYDDEWYTNHGHGD